MSEVYEAFRSSPVPERYIGSELELITATSAEDIGVRKYLTSKNLAKARLTQYAVVKADPREVWLPNGGNFHQDGALAEHSSPEAAGPYDATVYEHAGLEVATRLVQAQHDTLYYATSVANQHHPTTVGVHDNLFFVGEQNEELALVRQIMATFTASSPIWCGAGLLTPKGFSLMQKGPSIGQSFGVQDVSGLTLEGYKVMGRIKPLAEREEHRGMMRVENRTIDASPSAVVGFVRRGAQSLMLRLVEWYDQLAPNEQERLHDLFVVNPVQALHDVSGDVSLNAVMTCQDGTRRTALAVQRELHSLATALAERVVLPDDELLALELWDDLLDITERYQHTRQLEEAALVLNWAHKWRLLQHPRVRAKAIASTDAMAAYADLLWSRHPNGGSQALRVRTLQKLGITAADITTATTSPPATTPAAQRGAAVLARAAGDNTIRAIDWTCVGDPDGHIQLLIPYSLQ